MEIIPLLKVIDMKRALSFYTTVLDFTPAGTWPENQSDPAFAILEREGAELHLSSHSGDSVLGAVACILVNDIHRLVHLYQSQGLLPSLKKDSPVHQHPVHQTWGTIEFYIDDPDGNQLRFIQRGVY